jgi:hypothetical protein
MVSIITAFISGWGDVFLETLLWRRHAVRGVPCFVLLYCLIGVCAGHRNPKRAAAPKPAAAGPSLNYPITLTDGKVKVVRTRRELGISAGADRKLTVDPVGLKRALGRIAPSFRQEAVNAKPYVYKGAIRIDPGTYARGLNVATTAAKLSQAIASNPATKTFTVMLDKKTAGADRRAPEGYHRGFGDDGDDHLREREAQYQYQDRR